MKFIAAMGLTALACSTATYAGTTPITINEFRGDQPSTDVNEYVELKGAPGASLAGYTFLIVGDGSATTKSGVIEFKWSFGAKDVIGSNGYLILRKPTMTLPIGAGTTIIDIAPDNATGVFENGNNTTLFLVTDYSGTMAQGATPTAGDDLDTNDDGVLDVTPWTSVVDSLSIKHSLGSTPDGGEVWWYSAVSVGPNAFRYTQTATTGTLIGGWDYQTTANGGTAAAASPLTPKVFVANVGSGSMFLDGTNGSSDWFVPAAGSTNTELNSFGGTASNAGPGMSTVTSGTASLALVNQTANGKSAVFTFSMLGYTGLNISYATQRTSSGFTTQQWAWSVDGDTWTDLETVSTIGTSFGVKTLTPTNVFDGSATCYLRLTVTGATSGTGNNRLDNVQLLTNPVTGDTQVTTYNAPMYITKGPAGTWAFGPDAIDGGWDTPGADNYFPPTYSCGDPAAGDPLAIRFNPFSADQCCCEFVCAADTYCCEVHWDSFCVTKAGECAAECTAGPCPADLDGDGAVGGADLGLLLGAWNTENADLNGDGIVNGADLGIMLGAWGPCP